MAATILFLPGCLIAPEIETEPEEELYPPEIVLLSLHPPDDGKTMLDGTSCEVGGHVVFKVTLVRDLNKKDTLFVRWFPDWDANGTEPSWSTEFVNPSGGIDRTISPYQLEIDRYRDGKIHTLKVFVADRPPETGGNGISLPPGSEGQWDTYQWTFLVGDSGYDCE